MPQAGEPSLRQTVLRDLRETRLPRTLWQDLKAIYRFYLDEETRQRLHSMGRVRRALWLLPWILKSLLFKLSPARRLMVLIAMVLYCLGDNHFQWGDVTIDLNLRGWGFLLLLVILMLELKDKLLAREEIEIARQVQRALLPSEHPRIAGWEVWSTTRPANDVGGDLVDYLDLDGSLGIALGDVAGKGLGAALLMSKLQATLRALRPDCPSLEMLGSRMNAILHRDGLENRFATLFYVELDPGSPRVRYLNAGHNPPFVLRQGRNESLPASSIPLGMFPEVSYVEGRAELDVGDVLVAYSDGLVEARNPSDEEFGMERLEAALAGARGDVPESAGAHVLAELQAFLSGERPGDDVSIFVVRRLA